MTPAQLIRKYQQRIAVLKKALKRGLTKAAAKVDRAQVDNLRGGVEPGDYPVPVRTGDLLGSHFFTVPDYTHAIVGNSSGHAIAIHEGKRSSAPYGRRPFLEDAVEEVDVAETLAIEIRRAWR